MLLTTHFLYVLVLLLACETFVVETRLVLLSRNETFADRLASFGPLLPPEGLTGWLLDVSDNNSKGCLPVDRKEIQKPWLALVERGECSFIDKVRAMQKSGAQAVVVGDNMPSDELTTMYAPGNTMDIQIPSVFIAQATYQHLKEQMSDRLSKQEPLKVVLLSNDYQLPLLDLLFVLVVSPLVMVVLFYLVYALFSCMRTRQHVRHMKHAIHSIPTKTFKQALKSENQPDTCAICLDEFIEDDELRVLLCKHEFHIVCIDPWLIRRSRLCPICKQDTMPTESTPLLEQVDVN